MQEFRQAFYQLLPKDQELVFYLKIPLDNLKKVHETVEELENKSGKYWGTIMYDLDRSQSIELFRTAWKSPEKLEEKLIQMQKSIEAALSETEKKSTGPSLNR